MEKKDFGLSDFPERRARLDEQSANLGMEAAKTQEQREDYAHQLVRGILTSDQLDSVRVVGETKLVHGQGGGNSIPEFERMVNMWTDFPRETLARIIEEEQRAICIEEARDEQEDDEEDQAEVA